MGRENEGSEPAVKVDVSMRRLGERRREVSHVQVGEDEVEGEVVGPVGTEEGEDDTGDPEGEEESGLEGRKVSCCVLLRDGRLTMTIS